MAWIDSRVWCHPKFADLSDAAFRLWVHGIAYCDGFGTKGHLTQGQLKTIGSTPRLRTLLVSAGLWDEGPLGSVNVHDWDDHNGTRDRRKEEARERMRAHRAANSSANTSANGAQNESALTGDRVKDDKGLTTEASYVAETALENIRKKLRGAR